MHPNTFISQTLPSAKTINMYKKHFTLTCLGLLLAVLSFAQGGFEFRLQLMQEELTWGVYMDVVGDEPSGSMVTASGQITVVMPADFDYSDVTDYNGKWDANAIVVSPLEDVERKYVSFGLVSAEPLFPIDYAQVDDVLLFSFKGEICPDSIYLIDCNTPNVNDPFCPDYQDNTPGLNSVFSNPGNDLSVLDLGQGGALYFFQDNVAPSAWNCHDCDGDGIPNAHEDTNGNGVYDPDEDVSDLCNGGTNPCEGITPDNAILSGGGTLCAGEGTEIFVEINGGTGPFMVVLSDGAQNIYVENYQSGDPIPVNPQEPTQYTLVRVEAGPVCELTTGLSGAAIVNVANALELVSSPSNSETCADEEVDFEAEVSNTNGTVTSYVWQISCDDGATWEDADTPGQTALPTISSQLNLIAESDMNGCQFRFRAWTSECGEVVSAAASISVSALPDIIQQPLAAETCSGEAVEFQVELSASAEIFWRKSCDDGATWTLIFPGDPDHEGIFSNTLTVLSASADDNGCLYQALIDDVASGNLCGTKFTEPAALSVRQAPEIMSQPASQTLCVGEIAQFDAVVADIDGVTFQWQQSCDSGASWADIDPSDVAYSGVQSASLSVQSSADNADCQYRLRAISGDCGDVISAPALLNAKAPVSFDAAPADYLACPDETVLFTAGADAFGAIDFQWQMSTNGVDFQDINSAGFGGFSGFNSNVLSVDNTDAVAGYSFRVAGSTDICSDRVFSDAAQLLVRETVSILTSPEGVDNCEGESAAFFSDVDFAGQSNVQLQWQQRLDGADWEDLAEGPNYSGVNTQELFIADNTGLFGSTYRIQATGDCRQVDSEVALLLTEDCSIDSNYLEMKIGLLPEGEGWGVYLRLAGGFEPNAYQTALSGRVVIATDAGFGFHSLISEAGGTWTPGTVVLENWQHPDTRYFTFNLEVNNNQLLLEPGNEIMLFRFKPIGECPKQMYILEDEDELPNGMEMPEFSAIDLDENLMFLSRIYDHDAWNCHGSALMVDQNASTETSAISNTLEAAPQDEEESSVVELDFASQKSGVLLSLTPNPAAEFVNIEVAPTSENARLLVLGMQGQILEAIHLQTTSDIRMELNHLPTGLYVFALEEDGVVVQRERLMKK